MPKYRTYFKDSDKSIGPSYDSKEEAERSLPDKEDYYGCKGRLEVREVFNHQDTDYERINLISSIGKKYDELSSLIEKYKSLNYRDDILITEMKNIGCEDGLIDLIKQIEV